MAYNCKLTYTADLKGRTKDSLLFMLKPLERDALVNNRRRWLNVFLKQICWAGCWAQVPMLQTGQSPTLTSPPLVHRCSDSHTTRTTQLRKPDLELLRHSAWGGGGCVLSRQQLRIFSHGLFSKHLFLLLVFSFSYQCRESYVSKNRRA